ncbi:hypothetical protein VYU27_007564 [Nannochloropsis oceanica]
MTTTTTTTTTTTASHGLGGFVSTHIPTSIAATCFSSISSSSSATTKAPVITLTATPMPLRAELKRRNSHPLRLGPGTSHVIAEDDGETLFHSTTSTKALLLVFAVYALVNGWNGFVAKGGEAAMEAVRELVLLVLLVVGVAPLLDHYFF